MDCGHWAPSPRAESRWNSRVYEHRDGRRRPLCPPALPLPPPFVFTRCPPCHCRRHGALCQHRQPSCDDTHELKGELKGVLPLRATAAGCTWPSSSSRHSATRCFQPVRALPSRVEYPNPIAAALTHPSRAALRVPRPKQLAPTHGRPSPVQSPAIPLNRSVEQVLNKC